MAREQDIWELIVKTVGQEDLKKLEAGLKDLNETAGDVNESSEKASKATKGLGGGFLELSRAAEDAQYGLAGVLNNIPSMIQRFGGPAGLAAMISLTAVAAKQLYDHWDDLMAIFGKTKPIQDTTADIKDLEAEIKKLEDKKIKVAVDYADIERAKKELKELTAAEAEREAQKKLQKATEAEAGKLIQDLITESAEGAEEIQRRTVQVFAERSKAQSVTISGIDAEIKRQKELLAVELDPDRIRMARMRIEELRAERTQAGTVIEQKAGKQYAGLLEKAKTGHGVDQIRAGEDLATLIREAGFKPLADAIEATTAAGLEAFDKEAAAFDRRMGQAKEAGAARRTKDTAQKKATEAAKKAADRDINDWAKEGEDFIAAREKAAADRARAFAVKQQIAREANKPFLEQETRAIKQGGFAEQAEAMLAGARARGMGPDQGFGMVQGQVGQQLARQFPGMPRGQREDMATRITAMGKQGLDQRMLDLQAQGVNANDRTLIAMEQALGAVQALTNKLQQNGAQADRLGRGFQQAGNFIAGTNQPGAGNTGGW